MTLLVLLAVFIGVVGVLISAYLFVNRRNLSATEAALQRLREVEEKQKSTSFRSILREESISDVEVLQKLLAGRGITGNLATRIQKAGVDLTPGSFLIRAAISVALGYLLGSLFAGTFGVVLGLAAGASAPFIWLRVKQAKRLQAFQEQLPDAIDMLVSAMKAGYSFQAAMKFIGEEMKDPLGPEFTRFYEEQRLGMEVRLALLSLQERIDSLDLKMFITAVLIQRETGGNLSEVLENISGLMRERQAIKGEIETLTAESKLSARILSALPLVVFLAVNLLNPGFMQPMLNQNVGIFMLILATTMVVSGYYMMMRIADIDI